jgi:serine/threonine protein kinase
MTPTEDHSNGDAGLLEMALEPEAGAQPSAVDGAPEVARYEVISRLGMGSSGEVWLADEVESGRTMALKILHRFGGAGASEEVLQREFRILPSSSTRTWWCSIMG